MDITDLCIKRIMQLKSENRLQLGDTVLAVKTVGCWLCPVIFRANGFGMFQFIRASLFSEECNCARHPIIAQTSHGSLHWQAVKCCTKSHQVVEKWKVSFLLSYPQGWIDVDWQCGLVGSLANKRQNSSKNKDNGNTAHSPASANWKWFTWARCIYQWEIHIAHVNKSF